MTLKGNAKFKVILTRGLKNFIRKLVNFNENSGKSANLHFDALFLSKVYYVWGTDLYFEKWHEAFDKFWPNSFGLLCHGTNRWCNI